MLACVCACVCSVPGTPVSNVLGLVGVAGDALLKMFKGAVRLRDYRPVLQGHIGGGGPLLTLFGHTAPVNAVAVSQSLGVAVVRMPPLSPLLVGLSSRTRIRVRLYRSPCLAYACLVPLP